VAFFFFTEYYEPSFPTLLDKVQALAHRSFLPFSPASDTYTASTMGTLLQNPQEDLLFFI